MKKNLAWLSDSETAAVAGELGVDPTEVREMERRLSARDLSFDPLPDAGDEDSIASPSLYLPSPEADPATIIEQDQWDGDVTARLSSALDGLDERSRTVIRSRWLAEEKKTLQELADDYGVSAERIRQIETVAITKLRSAMTG
jgi:RNA polymerase sigma-32 factor